MRVAVSVEAGQEAGLVSPDDERLPAHSGGGARSRSTLRAACSVVALAAALTLATPQASAETLREALAAAYQYNPRLDAERARLRATDEDVPRAKAGFRPQVLGSAETGRQKSETKPSDSSDGSTSPWGYSLTVSQSLFSGFKTVSAVNEAEANVRVGREILRSVEQQVLLEAATAFADVVRDAAIVKLRESNVRVLTKMLEATEARRGVREVTRTDVAQAKARRARSISQLDVARSNLKASRAAFEKVIGHPAGALTPTPPPAKLLPRSLEGAVGIAERENPLVTAALYREQGARHAVDRIRGELLPEVRLEASYGRRFDTQTSVLEQDSATITGRVTMPFYDGGETAARVRQAKHTHVSRLQEVEQNRAEAQAGSTQAWSKYVALRSQIESDRVLVESNRIALEGVREEEKAGQRTLLDVLNAEQELLDAEVQLVVSKHDLIVASHNLLAQIGRMSATDLSLFENVYDPNEHYEESRDKWHGVSIAPASGRGVKAVPNLAQEPVWILEE